MSTHELDADMEGWPKDPYQLLGVRPGVSPRDLRRAYTNLIRVYKPEQYPDHFRRLRDAYENISRHLEWFEKMRTQGSPAAPEKKADQEPGEKPGEGPSSPLPSEPGPAPSRPRVPTPEEELRKWWDQACRGKEAAVYQKMVELLRTRPDHPALCVRLYWLLSLFPKLDYQCSPCDWLARGLQASGLTGPLRELYRREITAHPSEALTPRYGRLLQCRVRPGLIADFAEWRWQAAGRLGEWNLIADDLRSLREEMSRAEEDVWGRLLLAAVDQLAWANDMESRQLMNQCCREIEERVHLGSPLHRELYRLDYLVELSNAWHSLPGLKGMPLFLVQFIPLSWTRAFPEVRPFVLTFLERVARQPETMVPQLDWVQRVNRVLLAQVGKMLEAYQNSLPAPPKERPLSEALVSVVLDFLDANVWPSYPAFRYRLLEFCNQEAVSPELIVRVVADRPLYQLSAGEHLSQRLTSDWPLRYVCQAYRLFWA